MRPYTPFPTPQGVVAPVVEALSQLEKGLKGKKENNIFSLFISQMKFQ